MSNIEDVIDPWWEACDAHPVRRGQLIKAFVPHVDLLPQTLVPQGRTEATDHSSALFKLEPLRLGPRSSSSRLPVAALPEFPNEIYSIHRAKVRYCIVLSMGGQDIPKQLRSGGSPKWQTAATLLVVPAYGVEQSDTRAGWNEQFVERIRQCEYPQYLLTQLPIKTSTRSIFRLDHLQPIGRHHQTFEPLGYRLSSDALDIVDEWVSWLKTGQLEAKGPLAVTKELLSSS